MRVIEHGVSGRAENQGCSEGETPGEKNSSHEAIAAGEMSAS
jgi:hypothetical protein